jgi:hypothetical protein
MKNQLIRAVVVVILTLISANGNGADPRSLIESKKSGTIDWTTGVVKAKGTGAPAPYTYPPKPRTQGEEILSEAVTKAGHNLLETIVSLRIDSQNRVIDIVENFPSIMKQLRNMAQNAWKPGHRCHLVVGFPNSFYLRKSGRSNPSNKFLSPRVPRNC